MSDPRFMRMARTEPRRDYNAYEFVADTVCEMPLAVKGKVEHFMPNEVVDACVSRAVYYFGFMAPVVFKIWGIITARDIGDIVLRLIEAEILLGGPEDTREAFTDLAKLFEESNDRPE